MTSMISRQQLIELVCPGATAPAAKECCIALNAASTPMVRGALVERSHLLRIYRMRLARNPDAVIGADELIRSLEAHTATEVRLCVLEWEGRVYGMLCDADWSAVVACFVGDDRRAIDTSGSDEG